MATCGLRMEKLERETDRKSYTMYREASFPALNIFLQLNCAPSLQSVADRCNLLAT